jgi:hypothetical protein
MPRQVFICTGHGPHDLVGMLAAGYQASIAWAQPHWGLPAEVLHGLGWGFQPPVAGPTDVGWVAVCPGAFHKR